MPVYRYTEPFEIAQSTTVKFVAVADDGTISELQTAAYEIYQVGSFDLPAVSLQPTVAAPSMVGVSVGSFSLPAVSVQPQVVAPLLLGNNATSGSFSLPSVSLQPQVVTPGLEGVQVGEFSIPAVSVQPVVSAPSMEVTAVVSAGSFTLPAITVQPSVNPPVLVGVTSGTSIRAPDGTVLDLRDIYGNPIDLRVAA